MIMQTLHKYISLLGVILFFITKSYAQSLPITSYGVWDRGGGVPDYSDPKADFVKGIETSARWEDIQPNGPATFDFSAFQTILDVAVANNKLIRFSINVGPDCPMWVFDNGVPLVNVISNAPKNDAYANRNPYYPDPEYKIFYFKMIEEFALFLRNQPQEKFDNIAFVQVKTGATGDEEPYKGTVINPIYNITVANWEAFRLEAFAKFKQYFNDVTDRKIVLTFNNVDPVDEPNAYNYVMTQLDPVLGFGIKGGAYNRGHHLSDEQTYKEQWNPFLINPKVSTGNPNGIKLFSASEMDQSWSKGYFALNYEIGFYWSALGGINTGLSCTNISVSAMQYAFANPGIIEIFKMYNRYAQQVYPATATTAFSVFHEGLNSADTVKFPESIYGNASKTNLTRYQNICNDPKYANRGARIDDPIAVVKGQVFQREDQEFYNDAGWEICEGNIERFMTQINPDATSIGLFRVRGTITATSSKYDRFARSFENSTGKNTMYFQLNNEVPATNKNLKFTIIWLDKTAGSTWAFKYRNSAGLQTIAFTGTGTNQWVIETFNISDGVMNQGGVNGSDFMLVNTDAIDDIFNGIEMNIIGISKQDQTINFNPLPFKKVGDADFNPGATASSGLEITYMSSNTNVATIINNTIHIVGLGVSTITASQAGNDSYNPATSVVQDLTVVNQTTITTVGNAIWVAPEGVTSITVECWGGGGSGGSTSTGGVGGGGAGGSYVINNNVSVVPGSSYSITVGASGVASTNGSSDGTPGGDSQFASTIPVIANGGVNGKGAIGTSGSINTAFGLGGINLVGGSGGTVTLGSSGADAATSSGGKGGDGAGPNGGSGGASDTVASGTGNPGSSPGGGGSGAFGAATGGRAGGAGGAGQIKISYTVGVPNPIVSNGTGGGSWSATTTWTGGVVPAQNDTVEILGSDSVTLNGIGICNNLTITSGSLTVSSGSLTVKNTIVNNGILVVENNANLIQTAADNTNSGSGSAIVKRNSNPLFRLDYTMWSSPVSGTQKLADFSPLTSQSPNRFYEYTEATDTYSAVSSTGTFAPAKGYLIRMPNTDPLTGYNAGSATLAYSGVFSGSINNGNIPVTMTKLLNGYTAVGNPYPSVIDATIFINANTANIESTLYFWRKTNGASGSAYATYTAAGGTSATPTSAVPNGKIQVGQGFFVKAKNAVTVPAFFTNGMRDTAPTSTQFFKTKQIVEKDRVWVNLTNATGVFSQALIAYITDATIGIDHYDGKYINDSPIALTSKINNEEYSIQGRPAFDVTDVVALNFKTDVAGDYSIALDHFDGLFITGQAIYLMDSKTGIETDLKLGAYNFNTLAGVDNTRFSLKYQKTLKVDAPAFNENSVRVYKNNSTLYVNSGNVAISNITVFDIQGRLIAEQKNVKATTATIHNLKAINQVLIVKIIAENNQEVIKKIVN